MASNSRIDLEKRNRLLRKYAPDLFDEDAEPAESEGVVTIGIREFFDGNDDPGTIGNGRADELGLDLFKSTLLGLLDRPDVADVRVDVVEWPNPLHEGDDDMWPLAETVYVWTSASVEQVQRWLAPLAPDGLWERPLAEIGRGPDAAPLPPGMRVFGAMWD